MKEWIVAAVLAAAFCLPAHAQLGGLLNMIQQQQQQEQQKKEAERQADAAAPEKRFAPGKPVPAPVQAAAAEFAARAPVPELRPLYERLYVEGERNAALNFQRIGLAALSLGNLDLAEKALDLATARIEMIYADNPEAQQAKSKFTAEKVKDYKGEPYERVMAYYYRGLVYMARGDFQNARAMFKQADYQDTVAEVEQFAGDFSLMPYLAGWASYCDGNSSLAKDFLQMATKADRNYAEVSVEQPVVVLFEAGRSPFKVGGGKFGEALMWRPYQAPMQKATAACRSGASDCFIDKMVLGADIGFQATTRGGRQFDAILNGKASFKEGAQNFSNVASVAGQVGSMAGNENVAALGFVASMVSQGVSNSTEAQADTREWEQLPGSVWLGTSGSRQEASRATVTVDIGGLTAFLPLRRIVDSKRCQLYWGRTFSPLSVQGSAGPLEPGEHKRDPVFRREIAEAFASQ